MHKRQAGFTLIEIAIVLVIIGLLLGGVLKGQELITSARVRNMISTQDGIRRPTSGSSTATAVCRETIPRPTPRPTFPDAQPVSEAMQTARLPGLTSPRSCGNTCLRQDLSRAATPIPLLAQAHWRRILRQIRMARSFS